MMWSVTEGRTIALKVVTETLSRIIEDVKREKLELLWTCLLEEVVQELEKFSLINESAQKASPPASADLVNGNAHHDEAGKIGINGAHESPDTSVHSKEDALLHLAACLSLLSGVIEYRKGTRVKGEYSPWRLFHFLEVVVTLFKSSGFEVECESDKQDQSFDFLMVSIAKECDKMQEVTSNLCC